MIKPNAEFVSGRQEWARNWKIPLVSALAYGFAQSHTFSLGVIMPALESETGWSRSQISAGLTYFSVLVFVLAPFLGRALDRFGPRPIALLGVVIYGLSFAFFSVVGASIWQWWLVWFILGVGFVLTATPVWASAVVSLFTRARGLALAVTLSGAGLSSTIMPKITDYLMSSVGWRGTYLGIGLGGGALICVLLWIFFLSDEKHSLTHSPANGGKTPRTAADTADFRKAALSWTVISMSMSALLMTLMMMCYLVHFVPILLENGISSGTAASIAGAIGVSAMAGRVLVGLLLDRVRANRIGVAIFSLPALVSLIMLTSPGPGLAVVAAVLVGFTVGAEYDIFAYAVSRYFNHNLYGSLFAIVYALSILGAAGGPLIGA